MRYFHLFLVPTTEDKEREKRKVGEKKLKRKTGNGREIKREKEEQRERAERSG